MYFFLFFQHETIAGYRAYIHGIVGFFVVEDHVLNTGNGLVNRTYLDEVWSMALSKIVNALRTHSVSNINIYTSDIQAIRPLATRVQEGAMHPVGICRTSKRNLLISLLKNV